MLMRWKSSIHRGDDRRYPEDPPSLWLTSERAWVWYRVWAKDAGAAFCLPAAFRSIESACSWCTQDQLVVEWQSSTPDVDTWMVEWVPDLDSEISTISWESVTHARNWTIQQGSQCRVAHGTLCIVRCFTFNMLLIVALVSRLYNVAGWLAVASRERWHMHFLVMMGHGIVLLDQNLALLQVENTILAISR